MSRASATLDGFRIEHEVSVISAHRAPDRLAGHCGTARERGLNILITAELAASILTLGDARLRDALDTCRARQTQVVLELPDPRGA